MTFAARTWGIVVALALLAACGDDDASGVDAATTGADGAVLDGSRDDAGADASPGVDAAADAASPLDAGDAAADASPVDAGRSCLAAGRGVGDRYPTGDGCNFCACESDGSETCTSRTCAPTGMECDYDGSTKPYGARFPSTDGCNECVCAASGLACTRRPCTTVEEGAILLESLDAPCGPNAAFTPRNVLNEMPTTSIDAPFVYQRDRELYPETLADTTVGFRMVYDGGFAVCRIPSEGQEALDIEVYVEWTTADGAFDEGFHTYVRKNDFGFVDAWLFAMGVPVGGLSGTHSPACPDARGYGFSAQIERDGSASGGVFKTCETDIGLDVGTFLAPAP